MQIIPEHEFQEERIKQFHIELLENKELFMTLEQQSRLCLTENDIGSGNNLIDLAHCFDKTFPALSIIFARAAMLEQCDAFLDNEVLLEVIRNARTDLELDTYSDPIEDVLEGAMDMHDQYSELEEKEKEINALKQKISEGRRVAVHKDRELREKEHELKALSKKLEEGSIPEVNQNCQYEPAAEQSQQQENVASLKRRIEQLKMEIREQQQERRRLHQELESKEKAEARKSLTETSEKESPSTEDQVEVQEVPALKRVHVPVYSDQFKKSCKNIPPGIVAKALRAATGFATHDSHTLRQSKQLEKVPFVYRIRVGSNYRLLIQWRKGEDLEVLDLIPREELDTWISNHVGRKTG